MRFFEWRAFRWAPVVGLCFVLGLGQTVRGALVTRVVNVSLNAANLDVYDLDVDLNGTNDFKFTTELVLDLDPNLSVGLDVVNFPFASNNGVVIDLFDPNRFPNATRFVRRGQWRENAENSLAQRRSTRDRFRQTSLLVESDATTLAGAAGIPDMAGVGDPVRHANRADLCAGPLNLNQ